MTGITTINLGGQMRTLSFKNNFLFLLGVTLKCDPIDAPKAIEEIVLHKSAMQAIATIIYCGLVAQYERTAQYEHGLTMAQVAEWVDDADQNEFTGVWDAFAQIMGIPKATEEQIKAYEERLKKNTTQNQTKLQLSKKKK